MNKTAELEALLFVTGEEGLSLRDLSSLLNIVLDLFFIVQIGTGTAGAAYATVIAQAVSGILCLIYMKKKFDIHFSMKLRLNMIFMGLLLFVALFIHMNGKVINSQPLLMICRLTTKRMYARVSIKPTWLSKKLLLCKRLTLELCWMLLLVQLISNKLKSKRYGKSF